LSPPTPKRKNKLKQGRRRLRPMVELWVSERECLDLSVSFKGLCF